MKKSLMICMALLFGAMQAHSAIIDYAGGTAYLSDATSVVTDNTNTYYNVDYYIEDGFKVDFQGSDGIIGNYYGTFSRPTPLNNSVMHGHWGIDALTSVVFSKTDASPFDLNYLDLTSNTTFGGGLASGTELTIITSSGAFSLTLPSSDWGIGWDSTGTIPSDGIVRMWLGSEFDNITSFTLTSENAYCIGMDNFYIDEEAPPVPEPSTFILLGAGLAGLVAWRKKRA